MRLEVRRQPGGNIVSPDRETRPLHRHGLGKSGRDRETETDHAVRVCSVGEMMGVLIALADDRVRGRYRAARELLLWHGQRRGSLSRRRQRDRNRESQQRGDAPMKQPSDHAASIDRA